MSLDSVLETYTQQELFSLVLGMTLEDEKVITEIFRYINKKMIQEGNINLNPSTENDKRILFLLAKYGKETIDIWFSRIIEIYGSTNNLKIINILLSVCSNNRKIFKLWFSKFKKHIKSSIFSNIQVLLVQLLNDYPDLVDIWGKELSGIILKTYSHKKTLVLFSEFIYKMPDQIEHWFPIFEDHECIKIIIKGLHADKLKEIQIQYFLKEGGK